MTPDLCGLKCFDEKNYFNFVNKEQASIPWSPLNTFCVFRQSDKLSFPASISL